MKVKVDKEEYKRLLKRVEELEKYSNEDYIRYGKMLDKLNKLMEEFFEHKCMTVMVKRDRNMIAAEIRKNEMDKLFGELNERK